jgi:transcriptional regulator with XRE-family HTH domain
MYRTNEEVAGRIRELRDERGMTQRALADALGVDPAAMSRIEKAERGLSTGELVGVAEALGVSVDTILRKQEASYALRADCDGESLRDDLAFFREVIADLFAAEALAR